MTMPGRQLLPGVDQALVDRVELIRSLRDDVALDCLFEPVPLEHRALEDRGGGVRIVFQQLCRAVAVEREIEPAVEAAIVAVPALGNQGPERFRYLQPAQDAFVVDRAADEFETHGVDLGGRRLDSALDFVQRKRVVGALVPIAFAVDGVKIESGAFGSCAPVVTFRAFDAPHGRCQPPPSAALPAAVPVNVGTTRRERFMVEVLLLAAAVFTAGWS